MLKTNINLTLPIVILVNLIRPLGIRINCGYRTIHSRVIYIIRCMYSLAWPTIKMIKQGTLCKL